MSGLFGAGIFIQNVSRDASRADSGCNTAVSGAISDGLDTDFTVVGAVKNVAGNAAGTEGLRDCEAKGGIINVLNDSGLTVGDRLRGSFRACAFFGVVRKAGGADCASVGIC